MSRRPTLRATTRVTQHKGTVMGIHLRRLQFRLAHLFLGVAVAAVCALGIRSMILQERFERSVLRQITEKHGLDVEVVQRNLLGDWAIDILPCLNRVIYLGVDYTEFCDAELHQVARFPQLRGLSVSHTKITDRGVAALATHRRLLLLNVSSTSISDSGLRSIGRIHALEDLYMVDTMVSDEGISCLEGQRNLRTLSLVATTISDASIPTLLKLPLIDLDVQWTGVSTDGQRVLNNHVKQQNRNLSQRDCTR